MADTVNDGYSADIGFPETDTTLLVEEKKIYVNKAVLSQHSPVFKAMFSGSFKESTANEITLGNKKAKDVVEFIRCFYPNMNHPITERNVLQILPLAIEYQSSVVTDCEKFMQSMCCQGKCLTVTTLLDYILAAEKYGLQEFLNTATKFCADVDFDLLNGKRFQRQRINYCNKTFNYRETLDKDISLKYSRIDPKTSLAIAENRLKTLEMRNRKKINGDPTDESDKDMLLILR